MGGGRWDTNTYNSTRALRQSQGVDDFQYTKTATKSTGIHESLDPRRINKKPAGCLESRDSVDHPESLPIIVTFDVTGSNYRNAIAAQKKLPNLMEMLIAYVPDPQLAIWANDDVKAEGTRAIQCSEFESDVRIDEAIRSTLLTNNGGGNGGESYDLLLYAAARKVKTDHFEQRGKKGYLIMYCDEPFFDRVDAGEVKTIFDDDIEADIPIRDMIAEVQTKWKVCILWPARGGQLDARLQYESLFGKENVHVLEGPDMICEMVASIVGLSEEKVTKDKVVEDLVAKGATKEDAEAVASGATPQAAAASASATGKPSWGGAKADRI